jgi:hypothetical protein
MNKTEDKMKGALRILDERDKTTNLRLLYHLGKICCSVNYYFQNFNLIYLCVEDVKLHLGLITMLFRRIGAEVTELHACLALV